MVDFSKPINNADMVQGLNGLIHRNMDLLANYEQDFIKVLEDRAVIDGVQELKNLHERHAHLLADTVRALGGAPDFREDSHRLVSKSKSWLGKLRQDSGVLGLIETEEDKLQSRYRESREALKASPESVAVITQALEEREGPLQWLHQVAEGGRA